MPAITKTVILGAGPHAGVICDILRHDPTVHIVGFTDLKLDPTQREFHGLPILGTDKVLGELKTNHQADGLIAALGWELLDKRRMLFERGAILGYRFVRAIHPSAVVSTGAEIGPGTALCAGAVVGPYARLGRHCVVNTNAGVDHDCELGENVFVNPGAAIGGGVQIGDDAVIGLGARVVERVRIGAHSIVGAGAVVLEDVPAGVVVVGVPARVLRENRPG